MHILPLAQPAEGTENAQPQPSLVSPFPADAEPSKHWQSSGTNPMLWISVRPNSSSRVEKPAAPNKSAAKFLVRHLLGQFR